MMRIIGTSLAVAAIALGCACRPTDHDRANQGTHTVPSISPDEPARTSDMGPGVNIYCGGNASAPRIDADIRRPAVVAEPVAAIDLDEDED